jgi:hypothetical protein
MCPAWQDQVPRRLPPMTRKRLVLGRYLESSASLKANWCTGPGWKCTRRDPRSTAPDQVAPSRKEHPASKHTSPSWQGAWQKETGRANAMARVKIANIRGSTKSPLAMTNPSRLDPATAAVETGTVANSTASSALG